MTTKNESYTIYNTEDFLNLLKIPADIYVWVGQSGGTYFKVDRKELIKSIKIKSIDIAQVSVMVVKYFETRIKNSVYINSIEVA
jgi:hypothetical protein